MNSKFLKLNSADRVKGLIVAAGTSILTGILNLINTGGAFTLENLKVIGLAGLAAGITYILKNLVTNSDGQISPENLP